LLSPQYDQRLRDANGGERHMGVDGRTGDNEQLLLRTLGVVIR